MHEEIAKETGGRQNARSVAHAHGCQYPDSILVSYDFTILLQPIDTYRDGILIWVVSYSYPDTYHDIFSIPIQK
jgi:hypothetical protein